MFSWPISRLCFRNPESRAGHRFWFSVVVVGGGGGGGGGGSGEKAYARPLKNGTKHMLPALERFFPLSRYYTSSWAVVEFLLRRISESFASALVFLNVHIRTRKCFGFEGVGEISAIAHVSFLLSVTDMLSAGLRKYLPNVPHGTQPDRQLTCAEFTRTAFARHPTRTRIGA